MDLSIITVSWNTLEVLQKCLESVFAQVRCDSFEVLVVDNASTDGSPEMVARRFPMVRLIRNGDNLGFASANNDAIRQAQGRHLLLLNSDTIVQEGAIDKALSFLISNPKVGVVGCRATYPDGSFQSSYYRVHKLVDLLMLRLLPFDFVPKNRLNRSRYWGRIFSQPREVEVVAGCFFLIRREVIDAVGMLDEDFFMYGEEEEWCFRIRQAGWRIVYYPDAQIIHIHGFSARKARKAMNLIARKSPLLVLEKTGGVLVAWFGNLIMTLGTLLRIPVWLLADLMKGGSLKTAEPLIRGRFRILFFHLAGLTRPIWRQRLPGEILRGHSG